MLRLRGGLRKNYRVLESAEKEAGKARGVFKVLQKEYGVRPSRVVLRREEEWSRKRGFGESVDKREIGMIGCWWFCFDFGEGHGRDWCFQGQGPGLA
jgi:hypothetical protein